MEATISTPLACHADLPPDDREERDTVESHHAFTRQSIDTIAQLAERVATRHGENHPVVVNVRDTFTTIGAALLRELGAQERGELLSHDASPLIAIREVTNNYSLPLDACLSFRALYERLDALEHDLQNHIALESEARS